MEMSPSTKINKLLFVTPWMDSGSLTDPGIIGEGECGVGNMEQWLRGDPNDGESLDSGGGGTRAPLSDRPHTEDIPLRKIKRIRLQ